MMRKGISLRTSYFVQLLRTTYYVEVPCLLSKVILDENKFKLTNFSILEEIITVVQTFLDLKKAISRSWNKWYLILHLIIMISPIFANIIFFFIKSSLALSFFFSFVLLLLLRTSYFVLRIATKYYINFNYYK